MVTIVSESLPGPPYINVLPGAREPWRERRDRSPNLLSKLQ